MDSLNQSNCLTLRYLHIHIQYTCFLDHLIGHVPNLERLIVRFRHSLKFPTQSNSNTEKLTTSNESWFNKVRQIEYDHRNLSYEIIFFFKLYFYINHYSYQKLFCRKRREKKYWKMMT